jgi:ferredoxin
VGPYGWGPREVAIQGTSTIETPAGTIEFVVDAERCIGCVACVNVFPHIFRLEGAGAVAYASVSPETAPVARVQGSCPVDAIRPAAPRPDPQAVSSLDVVSGWEQEWEKRRDRPEDLAERDRRYGRRQRVHRVGQVYVLQVELPRELPAHELFTMHGIANEAPEYTVTVLRTEPDAVMVLARLVDPRLRFLAGKMNSFPTGFRVDHRFPEPIESFHRRLDARDAWVYALPRGAGEVAARLAEAVRAHLSES